MNRTPLRLTLAVAMLALCATPVFAANKDMIQLQTEVQQLNDAVNRLQQSHDRDMGMLTDLVKQTVDSVNKMASTMSDLQHRVQATSDAQSGNSDQISHQIQSLNDSIDELRARLNQIDKTLSGIQSQQQSMGANIQNLVPAAGATPAGTAPAGTVPAGTAPGAAPSATPGGMTPENAPPGTPLSSLTQSGQSNAALPINPEAPPMKDIYNTALGDYMAAKFTLAAAEFNDVIHFYGDNDLAGNAYFYLGEIDRSKHDYTAATRNYDSVLEKYPNNNKIPAAHLHKAESLLALKQTSAGERELQYLIQRFPNSPEATQARSRLSAMGVRAR